MDSSANVKPGFNCFYRKHYLRTVTDMYDASLFPSETFAAKRVTGDIKIPLNTLVRNKKNRLSHLFNPL